MYIIYYTHVCVCHVQRVGILVFINNNNNRCAPSPSPVTEPSEGRGVACRLRIANDNRGRWGFCTPITVSR